ncbi:hypothetical protein [Vibrio alginolyticus]|uniref:hypothetical protein n=1 Tax=Vibrio alginolyticus TaxID=663 RepID=UPI001BD5612F|nr:hypothetical protein [Vibrio alginolyticus]MBS9851661.1 hypothetical protein [Vibrio alginolyticus]MCS0106575.1 hypothetical protein [Vibrio alginolyticus]
MSKTSNYNQSDIESLAKNKGYDYLSGDHKNGLSLHTLRCKTCGYVQKKTSKTILSTTKGQCNAQPCHTKGVYPLIYLHDTNQNRDFYLTIARPFTEPIDTILIEKNKESEFIFWRKGNDSGVVNTGSIFTKKGERDPSKPKRKKKPKLNNAQLAELCISKGLKIAGDIQPKAKKTTYKIKKCGCTTELNFQQVESFVDCLSCYPLEVRAFDDFNRFLQPFHKHLPETIGELHLSKKQSQRLRHKATVDRNQLVSIQCNICKAVNNARSYDNVRYRGFTYCDNPECFTTYSTKDLIKRDRPYYQKLVEEHEITSWSEFQSLFPKAFLWIFQAHHPERHSAHNKIYEQLSTYNSFLSIETRDFTNDEVRACVQEAISKGLTSKEQVLNSMPQPMQRFCNRLKHRGINTLNDIMTDEGIQLKITTYDTIVIDLPSAIEQIEKNLVKNWGALSTYYPTLCARINELNLKEDICNYFGWTILAEYSKLTDIELFDFALKEIAAKNIKSVSEFTTQTSYGLQKNLNDRGLQRDLYSQCGWKMMNYYDQWDLEKMIKHTKSYISISQWSTTCAGSYKASLRFDWVDEVAKAHKWFGHKIPDNHDNYFPSRAEALTSNLLVALGLRHKHDLSIDRFPGPKGGTCRYDFFLDDYQVWVEVWAYALHENRESTGKFEDYIFIRKYKTENYVENNMELAELEGGIVARRVTIKGQKLRGELDYLKHAMDVISEKTGCKTLSQAELKSLQLKRKVSKT